MFSYRQLTGARNEHRQRVNGASRVKRWPVEWVLGIVVLLWVVVWMAADVLQDSPRVVRGVVAYRVQPGDTLWSIVEKERLEGDTRHWVEWLLEFNHLPNSNSLRPGEILRVPQPTGHLP